MSVIIAKQQQGYVAALTPPHVSRPWRSQQARPAKELIAHLKSLGADDKIIYAALAKADPDRFSLFKTGWTPQPAALSQVKSALRLVP